MLQNPLKQALDGGRAVFGLGVTGPIDLPTLRTLAVAGVEWLFTDLEHGSLDISELLTVVQTAELLGLVSVPRIPDLSYHWVARSLDTGAPGVMIPRVETAEQARQAVQWARFPPLGGRGMGSPSYLSYAPVSIAEGIAIANRETLIMVQIESVRAVENVEAIAAVPGVDVLFIGPSDLAISLGRPGDVAGEASLALYATVCAAAQRHGLAVGIVCTAERVDRYHAMGMRLFSIGTALGHLHNAVSAARRTFEQHSGR